MCHALMKRHNVAPGREGHMTAVGVSAQFVGKKYDHFLLKNCLCIYNENDVEMHV